LARESAGRKIDLAARLLVAAGLLLWCSVAAAQELVHFPSSDDNGPGQPATVLDGYLLRPAGDGRHPAVVFLPSTRSAPTRRSPSTARGPRPENRRAARLNKKPARGALEQTELCQTIRSRSKHAPLRMAGAATPASNEKADRLIFKRVEDIFAKYPIATS